MDNNKYNKYFMNYIEDCHQHIMSYAEKEYPEYFKYITEKNNENHKLSDFCDTDEEYEEDIEIM